MQTMQSYIKVALCSSSGQILTGRDVALPSPIIVQIGKGRFFIIKMKAQLTVLYNFYPLSQYVK